MTSESEIKRDRENEKKGGEKKWRRRFKSQYNKIQGYIDVFKITRDGNNLYYIFMP